MNHQSDAIKFMYFASENHGYQKPFSYARLNRLLSDALKFAIANDFQFFKDDFKIIDKDFRLSYWGGINRHMLGECFYSLACGGTYGDDVHRSACIAFETWVDRKPFIIKTYDKYAKRIKSMRIAIDSSFTWDDETVRCTSFNEKGDKLTACSYKDCEKLYPRIVKKRYSITINDLKEHNKIECNKKEQNNE